MERFDVGIVAIIPMTLQLAYSRQLVDDISINRLSKEMLKIATSITFKMKALPEPNSMLVNTLANPSASAIVLDAAAKRVSKMSCFIER